MHPRIHGTVQHTEIRNCQAFKAETVSEKVTSRRTVEGTDILTVVYKLNTFTQNSLFQVFAVIKCQTAELQMILAGHNNGYQSVAILKCPRSDIGDLIREHQIAEL